MAYPHWPAPRASLFLPCVHRTTRPSSAYSARPSSSARTCSLSLFFSHCALAPHVSTPWLFLFLPHALPSFFVTPAMALPSKASLRRRTCKAGGQSCLSAMPLPSTAPHSAYKALSRPHSSPLSSACAHALTATGNPPLPRLNHHRRRPPKLRRVPP